jgi:hypothetical protein
MQVCTTVVARTSAPCRRAICSYGALEHELAVRDGVRARRVDGQCGLQALEQDVAVVRGSGAALTVHRGGDTDPEQREGDAVTDGPVVRDRHGQTMYVLLMIAPLRA